MANKSINKCQVMHAQRCQRRGARGKYKHMPSRRLIRNLIAEKIINEILREERERADTQEPETATCPGCGKSGESNQKDGGFYCYGSDRCCP